MSAQEEFNITTSEIYKKIWDKNPKKLKPYFYKDVSLIEVYNFFAE